jgi:hypothetical protein
MQPWRHRRVVAMSGGGAAAFSPTSLSGLALYYDATKISGFSNNDPIGTLTDLSSNAWQATQATASQKPTYLTNIKNGQPVIRFDGVDDILTNSTCTSFNGLTGATLFYAFKFNSVGSAGQLSFWNDARLSQQDFGGNHSTYADGSSGAPYPTGSYAVSTSWQLIEIVFDGSQTGNADRLKIWVDGVAKTLSFTDTIPASFLSGSDGFELGGGLGGNYNGHDLAVLCYYSRALTSGERYQVRSYINGLYAIY